MSEPDPDIFNHGHADDCRCGYCGPECGYCELQAVPLPRTAYLPGRGVCRVLSYDGNDRFTVLTKRDERVLVHRNRLSFRK